MTAAASIKIAKTACLRGWTTTSPSPSASRTCARPCAAPFAPRAIALFNGMPSLDPQALARLREVTGEGGDAVIADLIDLFLGGAPDQIRSLKRASRTAITAPPATSLTPSRAAPARWAPPPLVPLRAHRARRRRAEP
ncbi:MAG: hypothetical protein R3F14_26660 [Polyangiaceae bacterium]